MDIPRILLELRRERELLDDAILKLERLMLSGRRKRGRPPAWMSQMNAKREALQEPEEEMA